MKKFNAFLNTTSYTKITVTYIVLLFFGFLSLLKNSKSENLNFIPEKVLSELKFEHNKDFEEKNINAFARKIYIEEAFQRLIDYKIRKSVFTLKDDEKTYILRDLEAKKAKIEINNRNSYLIKEIQHEIDVIKTGYNPINFIMEYLLNLESNEFLKNQAKYFYILLITLIFTSLMLLKRLNKFKPD